MPKVAALLLIFFGETFQIVAEMFSSKWYSSGAASTLSIFITMFACIAVGGAMLVGGYMLGYVHFKNIWIITVVSVGTLLVVEPIVALILFRQLPTAGAAIGLILGALGTAAALFL